VRADGAAVHDDQGPLDLGGDRGLVDAAVRPLAEQDVDPVIRLSLAAWQPVFESFEMVLGSEIFAKLYPDWRASQAALVEEVCRDNEKYTVCVAEVEGEVVGFLAYRLDAEEKQGEIYLLAVDPAYQNRGIGTRLNDLALQKMVEGGMTLAFVGTGGDPAHAPARRTYEKVGFTPIVNVLYYKSLP
jgi:N-acetylglutamate synthase-like GNAT family acetyltransferase